MKTACILIALACGVCTMLAHFGHISKDAEPSFGMAASLFTVAFMLIPDRRHSR
jgi:hypothetical protein